ncbi:MAG: rubredoxin-like domain-containing protein [Halosimplex sp.]
MSGRGETPEEEPEREATDEVESLSFGQTLYNEEGDPVGTIRGMEEGGVFVTTRDGVEGLSVEHARSGHSFGAAELMWRCTNCGEMGEIEDGLPENCPNCGVEKEDLMYWTED